MAALTIILIAIIILTQFAHSRVIQQEDWETQLKEKQHPWERSGKYEGDIILQYDPNRNAMYNPKYHWPNNELPYEIAEDFSEEDKNVILKCLNYLNDNTCIKAIPWRSTDKWGLYFADNAGKGCSTTLGFARRRQTVNMEVNAGCIQFGVVMHEILHALGMWHQQSAHNRDDYIEIKWENIIQGMEHNFNVAYGNTGSYGYEYDYDSIMHYSPYAFSKNGEKTITSKINGKTILMGQRNGLSQIDLAKLRAMYNCTT